VSQRMKKMN